MTGRLSGKTVVVTAAVQGTGEAITREFDAEGALVWPTGD
jgi:NAD(P)-dependent dehydrogenase (short-subunit alcohol dehydrogenase family)